MFDWLLAIALVLPPAAVADPSAALPPASEPPHRVMALPPPLLARLRAEVLAEPAPQLKRLDRLLHLVLDPGGLELVYDEQATGSVAQTLASRSANCVSFTLLFVALAREAGLDAFAQAIPETLSWRQEGGILYRNDHVNAGVLIAGRIHVVDIAADTVIALKPPARVPDQRLLALYYNNLAMQRMAAGASAAALDDMRRALELDPGHAPHWSNAGVLYLRLGQASAAESAYRRALALDPRYPGALYNLAEYGRRQGDAALEGEFRARLGRQQQTDPLHHFMQAENLERAGNFSQAVQHYRRAIELHRGEHRFHAALAGAYRQAGETRLAIKALRRARALAAGSARKAYDAEIERLSMSANAPAAAQPAPIQP